MLYDVFHADGSMDVAVPERYLDRLAEDPTFEGSRAHNINGDGSWLVLRGGEWHDLPRGERAAR